MIGSGLLAYWFDITHSAREEWIDWLLKDHMPSRVDSAFTSGRCYEAVDANSTHLALYEAETPEALLTPSYLQLLGQVSPEDRRRRGWYSNTVRATARVKTVCGRGTGSTLGVMRIAGACGDYVKIGSCLERDVLRALAREPRIGAVWLAENEPVIRERIDKVRETGHRDGFADWAVFVEAHHEADAASALARIDEIESWRALDLGRFSDRGLYRLLYSINRAV